MKATATLRRTLEEYKEKLAKADKEAFEAKQRAEGGGEELAKARADLGGAKAKERALEEEVR